MGCFYQFTHDDLCPACGRIHQVDMVPAGWADTRDRCEAAATAVVAREKYVGQCAGVPVEKVAAPTGEKFGFGGRLMLNKEAKIIALLCAEMLEEK